MATDPRRFAEWQHDVVNVRMLGEARFATTRRITGAERTVIQQITRNDPPHGWAARGDGPIRPNATITVEPVNGGTRSRVTFTLDFECHGIAFPCYRLHAGRRTRALQIATGTSRTRSNTASELMPRIDGHVPHGLCGRA